LVRLRCCLLPSAFCELVAAQLVIDAQCTAASNAHRP
jgi:hypothetical protein